MDLLGDIGGFSEAISILSIFGAFFSHKFFMQELSLKLYIRKLTKKELLKDKQPPPSPTSKENLKSLFSQINLPTKEILLDSLGCRKKKSSLKLFEAIEDKYAQDLDIVNVIS